MAAKTATKGDSCIYYNFSIGDLVIYYHFSESRFCYATDIVYLKRDLKSFVQYHNDHFKKIGKLKWKDEKEGFTIEAIENKHTGLFTAKAYLTLN